MTTTPPREGPRDQMQSGLPARHTNQREKERDRERYFTCSGGAPGARPVHISAAGHTSIYAAVYKRAIRSIGLDHWLGIRFAVLAVQALCNRQAPAPAGRWPTLENCTMFSQFS